jgi:hypothetical protein
MIKGKLFVGHCLLTVRKGANTISLFLSDDFRGKEGVPTAIIVTKAVITFIDELKQRCLWI